MLELALKLTVIGFILGMGVIEWGLENRWQERPKTRQRWTRTLMVFLIVVSIVDAIVAWRTHEQEHEEQERATRIEEGVQELVKLVRERDPTLTDEEALREISMELQALRKSTSELEDELEGVKRYGNVAKLNMIGLTGIAGNGIHEENWVLSELEDAYNYEQRDGETHASIRCDKNAIAFFEKAAEINPDFPFSFFALAICKAKREEEDWKRYAEKAVAIFEHTTEISGHHENHDWALKGLREMLELQQRKDAATQ